MNDNDNIMYASDILYTRSISGNIIQWQIVVSRESDTAKITKISGRFGGTLTENTTIVKSGKNAGKSNETSIFTQAIKEAKSFYKHKLKEGYNSYPFINANALEELVPLVRLDENGFNKPMKAQPYTERFAEGIAQPKINGVRAFVSKRVIPIPDLFSDGIEIVISSKEGLIYDVPHIANEFKTLWKDKNIPDDIIFDGELYILNTHVTTIGGAARNSKSEFNSKLGFIVFDLAIPDVTQIDRLKMRDIYLGEHKSPNLIEKSNVIINLVSYRVTSDNFINLTETWLHMNYEGGIFRDINAYYRFGSRPTTMMKLKKFYDAEYKLVDIIPAEKDTDSEGNPVGMFLCKTREGLLFKVTPVGYSKSARAIMLKSKHTLIDKLVTVKYYETTKNNIPFHANGWFRDYE